MSTDWTDLHRELPPAPPEPEPYDYAAIEVGRVEDAERQERNRLDHFGPDGRWNVERDFDHAAHWKRQMEARD